MCGIRPSDERGAALVTALVVIALLSAVAAGAASASLFELRTATNHRLAAQALGVAEAGLARAMAVLESRPGWRTAFTNSYSHPSLNVQVQDVFDFGADQGTYAVTFTSLGPRQVLIRSEGRVGLARRIVEARVELRAQPAMAYVLYVGSDFAMQRNATYVGDVFVNGDVEADGRTQVEGALYLRGEFVDKKGKDGKRDGERLKRVPRNVQATGGVYTGQPAVELALPPVGFYQALADTVISGSQAWNGVRLAPDSVTLVIGNLELTGPVTGRGTVVVTGRVTLDDVTYAEPSAFLQLISLGDIVLATKSDYHAVLLAYGELRIEGQPIDALGAWWAPAMEQEAVIQELRRDPRLDTAPPLPATPGLRVTLLEWKEVSQ